MLFQRVTCDKKGTFYNSYVSGLTTFFLQHSANRGTQKNFDAFKLKPFRFAGQDNHRISDCADLTSESFGANVIMLHLRVGVADHLYPLIGTAARRSPLPRERFSPLGSKRKTFARTEFFSV